MTIGFYDIEKHSGWTSGWSNTPVTNARVSYNGHILTYVPGSYKGLYEPDSAFTFGENEEFELTVKKSKMDDIHFHKHTLGIRPSGGPTADTLYGNEHIEIRFDANRDGFNTQFGFILYDQYAEIVGSGSISTDNENMVTYTLPVVPEASRVRIYLNCKYEDGDMEYETYSESYDYYYFAEYEYQP
jgi:hypothetical protein